MRKQPKLFFEFGPFRLDVEKGRLSRSGEIILLPPKAISLLLVLLKRPGQVVEKEAIMETLWPDIVVEDSNLTQTVHLLRKALGKGGDSESRIETLPKVGYRLIAEVREVWEQEIEKAERSASLDYSLVKPDSGATTEAEMDVEHMDAQRSSTSAWFQRHNVKVITLVFAGILAGMVLGLNVAMRLLGAGEGKAEVVTVAVLPFQSPNVRSATLALSSGMVETLIAKLNSAGKINALRGETISDYNNAKGGSKVKAVISGSLEKVDGRLRLTVQMRRRADNQLLMEAKFDEPFDPSSGTADLEKKIAEKITAALEKQDSPGNESGDLRK